MFICSALHQIKYALILTVVNKQDYKKVLLQVACTKFHQRTEAGLIYLLRQVRMLHEILSLHWIADVRASVQRLSN